jgi:DNA-binding ferritin-like protein
MKENVIKELVRMQMQFKFLHWQTKKYSEHKTFEDLYNGLNDLIDDFVEVWMGKNGRPNFESEFTISFKDIENIDYISLMDDFIEYLVAFVEKLDPDYDTDLINLRDEIIALINKGKYLLTLN